MPNNKTKIFNQDYFVKTKMNLNPCHENWMSYNFSIFSFRYIYIEVYFCEGKNNYILHLIRLQSKTKQITDIRTTSI